jgi:hypothetical protein
MTLSKAAVVTKEPRIYNANTFGYLELFSPPGKDEGALATVKTDSAAIEK